MLTVTEKQKHRDVVELAGAQLSVNGVDIFIVEVLIMGGKLFDSNNLLGMDTIKTLGRIHVNQTGEVCFTTDEVPTCIALKFDKPDFSIDFNQQKCMWVASWK